MPRRILLEIEITFFFLILFQKSGISQDIVSRQIRIMFYNTENFFDIYDDPLSDDNDFLPEGVMRWNYKRYSGKINSLYKTIVAAGDWDPPAIVGFCEIEHRKILEDLIYGTYLSKFNYSIIHEESPDRRGIDVCLIYRKNYLRLLKYEYWIPHTANGSIFNSRSVLYTKFLIGNDTLHMIVNHWPSRRGGVLASEDNRLLVASMVRWKEDSILKFSATKAKLIILGDFNCSPEDQVIKLVTGMSDASDSMINLSDSIGLSGAGTYRYMGTWEMIDQVIVSKNLLYSKEGYYTNQGLHRIFKPDFLMYKDPKYPGLSPFPTYRGYRYSGGFSDHLPVLLDLKIK